MLILACNFCSTWVNTPNREKCPCGRVVEDEDTFDASKPAVATFHLDVAKAMALAETRGLLERVGTPGGEEPWNFPRNLALVARCWLCGAWNATDDDCECSCGARFTLPDPEEPEAEDRATATFTLDLDRLMKLAESEGFLDEIGERSKSSRHPFSAKVRAEENARSRAAEFRDAFGRAGGEDTEEELRRRRPLRALAGDVSCLIDSNYVTVSKLVEKLYEAAEGNSTIPETYEYDFARRVVAIGRTLGETERAALYYYTGVSEENLGEFASDAGEAVREAAAALYGENNFFGGTHYVYCKGEQKLGNLTRACVTCNDITRAYKLSGATEEVRSRVSEFLREYNNPGYNGSASPEAELSPGMIEVTLRRRAVCD